MIGFILDNWDVLLSLSLSLVAIIIALFSSRQTSKQASLQIEKLEVLTDTSIKNTDKQIEEIKTMTKNVADSATKHLLSMKEFACSLLELGILSLEKEIETALKEKETLESKYREELETLKTARKRAERAEVVLHQFYPREVDDTEQIKYLDQRLDALSRIKEQMFSLLEKIKIEGERIAYQLYDKEKS